MMSLIRIQQMFHKCLLFFGRIQVVQVFRLRHNHMNNVKKNLWQHLQHENIFTMSNETMMNDESKERKYSNYVNINIYIWSVNIEHTTTQTTNKTRLEISLCLINISILFEYKTNELQKTQDPKMETCISKCKCKRKIVSGI